MSSLIGSLTSTTRALDAQTYGLDVTGQNIANLNTDGYVRRSALLSEVAPLGDGSGGGVEVTGTTAQRDAYLEARLRADTAPEQREGAIADSLSVVETSLGTTGQSIDGSLTAFFDAYAQLAQDPTSAVARNGVQLQGKLLAQSFNDMSGRLDDSVRAVDASVRGAVDQVNTLARQIAALNASIASATGADVESLKDQEATALKTLAGVANVTVMVRADGGADVTIGTGRALVVGGNQYTLGVTSTAPSGLAAVTSGGVDITGELTGGRIGGLLHVRDTLIPGYKTQLDELAASVVSQVNALHSAGYDLNGSTGRNFFTPLGATAGAAAAMSVDPAVAADSTLIAASKIGTVGDNQVANAIAALRDAQVPALGNATFTSAWSTLVYQVGSDAQTAQQNQQSRLDIVNAVQRLRDSVSGVSLDQEAGQMLQFQRAYQANAKFFSTLNTTLDVLMSLVN